MPRASLTAWLTARRPARQVAFFRIGVGIAVLVRALKTARDLYLLEHDPMVIAAPLHAWAPRPASLPGMALVAGALLTTGIGLLLGVAPRSCAAIAAAVTIWLFFVDQSFWGNHVYFMVLMLLLLSFTDSGSSLSPRWLRAGAMAT